MDKILVEKCNQWGFFSAFLQVLDNLRWCEQNGYKPIIQWGSDSQYYIPEGYNGSYNVWEYYFEPTGVAITNKDIIKENHNNFLLKEIPKILAIEILKQVV